MALRTSPTVRVHPRSTIEEKIKHKNYNPGFFRPITARGSTLTYCSEVRALSQTDRMHIPPANSRCIQMKAEIAIRTVQVVPPSLRGA